MHPIKRSIYANLVAHSKEKEISLIVGPRQAGKTSLMQDLAEHLRGKGEKTIFLNLDVEDEAVFFESQRALISRLQAEFGSDRAFVFIDEIQRLKNAGLFLKGLYDLNLPYKFIVSGSGSLELKEAIHESMAGRKRLFKLGTLSFTEFAHFRTGYKYENRLGEFLSSDKNQANSLLNEYLIFGGYPRVVLAETAKEKLAQISEIFGSYVERDISALLGAEKRKEFGILIKRIASFAGKLIDYANLSDIAGLDVKTVKKYLWYLEKTFIIEEVRPFSKNKAREITRSPLYYFSDLGLRQFLTDRFSFRDILTDSVDAPFAFQNFIFGLLAAKRGQEGLLKSIYFWRTRSGAEVDFIYGDILNQLPIEVKFSSLDKPVIPRGLVSFLEKYKQPQAWVVNLNSIEQRNFGETLISFLPWWDARLLNP